GVGCVGCVVVVVDDGGGAVVDVVVESFGGWVVGVGSIGSDWLAPADQDPPSTSTPSRPLSSTARARRRVPAHSIVRWRSPRPPRVPSRDPDPYSSRYRTRRRMRSSVGGWLRNRLANCTFRPESGLMMNAW